HGAVARGAAKPGARHARLYRGRSQGDDRPLRACADAGRRAVSGAHGAEPGGRVLRLLRTKRHRLSHGPARNLAPAFAFGLACGAAPTANAAMTSDWKSLDAEVLVEPGKPFRLADRDPVRS